MGALQLCPTEVGTTQLRTTEPCAAKIGSAEVGVVHRGAVEVRPPQVGPPEVGVRHLCAVKACAAKVEPRQVCPVVRDAMAGGILLHRAGLRAGAEVRRLSGEGEWCRNGEAEYCEAGKGSGPHGESPTFVVRVLGG